MRPDPIRGLRMAIRAKLDARCTPTQARRLRKLHGVDHPDGLEQSYRDIAEAEERVVSSVFESIEQGRSRLEADAHLYALYLLTSARGEIRWRDCDHEADCSYMGGAIVERDPNTTYHMREETTVPTKPVETVTSEWQNQNVESHEGFTPMSTVAARMSGRPSWHDERRQQYNRNAEITDLLAAETRYDGKVYTKDEGDGVWREKDAEDFPLGGTSGHSLRPDVDAWESDRYNPDPAAR